MNSPTAESSDTAITTAINTHADAKEKWLALRQQYEQIATEFEQSLKQLKEPAAEQCPIESRIALLRRQMEILKWEINCTANSYISAHRDLMHTGIKTELGSFMASHGEALVSALSPLLLRLKDITQIASYEAVLDTAAQYLREELASRLPRSTDITPTVGQSQILQDAALYPDAQAFDDGRMAYRPAQHHQNALKKAELDALLKANQ